jgi:pimeloyl-ACP methyl ester carboxylesterase
MQVMSVEERWANVDGLRIRYLEAGSGPAVIMLHGVQAFLSSDIFTGVMEPIAAGGFRAIAYDQPGFGLSDNPSDFSTSYRINFIPKLMDALGIESAALIGHANGGGIVVRLALSEPGRVAAVIPFANLSLVPPLPVEQQTESPPVQAAPVASTPTLSSVRAEIEEDVYHKDLITPEVVEHKLQMSLGKNLIAEAEREKVREPWNDPIPVWERLRQIQVPLMLLFGDRDRESVAQRALLLKAQQPDLDIRLVPDASHLTHWDAPEAFTSDVLECLSRASWRAS